MIAPTVNVLHIVDSLGLGGTQTILRNYLESRTEDRTVHLYGLRSTPRQMTIAHPNVRVNPSSRRFSFGPLGEVRRIVRERSIGVLHCHLFRAQVFGYLLKTFFFPQVALVFHEHGRAVGKEGESTFEALMFRLFLRLAWQRVDRFICISDYTRTRLLHEIPKADRRTIVVPNPIPVHPRRGEKLDRDEQRHAHTVPPGAFVVGFASRLVDRKGWADFLGAMALVPAEVPFFFLLAGDGEDSAKAAARVKELGLAGKGLLLGHIDWMKPFYACLDCFVMPSHWEPHGLAQLEAQSFGVPVVVSDVPGLSSTVHRDRDALLFPAGDARALAECVHRLALDPELHRRIAAAGIDNAARYTMDAFAASLDDVYASMGAHPVAPQAGE